MSHVPIPANTGDFRLLDRRVVDAIKQLPERTRFMKGLFTWVGYRQTSVLFDREPRCSGKTTWNYWKLWNFAIDGITSFSFFAPQGMELRWGSGFADIVALCWVLSHSYPAVWR